MTAEIAHPRFLVFDLDGTLVDSSEDITRAVNRMLAERGAGHVRREDVVPLLGEGAPRLIREVLTLIAGAPADPEQVSECTQRYLQCYAEVPVRDSTLYPSVAETLTHLSAAGIPMAVCTNKHEALAIQVLEQLGALRHFHCIVGGDSLPVRKPDPAPLLEAVRRLGGDPRYSALVGDSEIDHECATRADMPFLLVPWASDGIPGKRVARFSDLLAASSSTPPLRTSSGASDHG